MLRRGAREVERDRIAGDDCRQAQLQVARRGLQDVDRLVAAVVQLGQPRAGPAFGVVERLAQSLAHVREPEALDQLREASGAGGSRGQLCAQVGAALTRVAHLPEDRGERVLVGTSGADDARRCDHHALVLE